MRKSLLLIITILITATSIFADVIYPNHHVVNKCIKITNTEEYPEVAVLGFIESVNSQNESYQVNPTTCLYNGYKYNKLSIYATPLSYLNGKEVSTLDLPNINVALKANIEIEPYGNMVPDTDPTIRIEEYYKIVGFSNTTIYIYKWKQVTGYNNGSSDLVENFNNPIKMEGIGQTITTSLQQNQMNTEASVFPNPASNFITVTVNNNYVGTGTIALININGEVVKSVNFNKQTDSFKTIINIESCKNGSYIVNITLGDKIVTKKIVIE